MDVEANLTNAMARCQLCFRGCGLSDDRRPTSCLRASVPSCLARSIAERWLLNAESGMVLVRCPLSADPAFPFVPSSLRAFVPFGTQAGLGLGFRRV